MNPAGNRSAFIQVITPQDSWHFNFSANEFWASKTVFDVRIGSNRFCSSGAELDICQNGISLTGHIRYGPFTPIAYNIMGPFALMPFIECSHAVHSLRHTLWGSLLLNGRSLSFSGGQGYIEQDWGRSFPPKYAWLQANDLAGNACLFVSIARIPYLGCVFTGCICVLRIGTREYRLATYLGVRILEWLQNSIVLRQGKYTLQICTQSSSGQKLLAPGNGALTRAIHENPSCPAHIIFYEGARILFEGASNTAGYEYVE